MSTDFFYIYILRCVDNSLYTGITNDVNKRVSAHISKSKECAKYTKNHQVQKLEALWKSENKSLALKLEFHIKKLSKQEKEELIMTNIFNEYLTNKVDVDKYERIDISQYNFN